MSFIEVLAHVLGGGVIGAGVHWSIGQIVLKSDLKKIITSSVIDNSEMVRAKIDQAVHNTLQTLRDKKRGKHLTTGDFIHSVTSPETFREIILQWKQNKLRQLVVECLRWTWRQPFLDRSVQEIINPTDFRPAAVILLDGVRNWLHRPESRKVIEEQIKQLIPQFSGFLGPLAAMFLNPMVLTEKLMPYLVSALNNPNLTIVLADQIEDIWEHESKQSIRDVILKLRPDFEEADAAFDALADQLAPIIPVLDLFEAIHDFPVDETWLEDQAQTWSGQLTTAILKNIPEWTDQLVGDLKKNVTVSNGILKWIMIIGAVSGGIVGFLLVLV